MKKKGLIPLTSEEKQSYHEESIWYICKKEFSSDDNKYHKVRDHCYCTGKYRGAAHNILIEDTKHQKKFPQYFIMVLNMTLIL